MQNIWYDYVVLGAGISGLTAAYRLQRLSKNFVVLEKENRVGGCIYSQEIKSTIVEKGANTISMNNAHVKLLIDELDLQDKICFSNQNSKNKIVQKNGSLKEFPQSAQQMLLTDFFSPSTRWHLLFEKRIPNMEDSITVYDFFSKTITEEFALYAVQPMIIGSFAGDIYTLQMRYAMPDFFTLYKQHQSVKKVFTILSNDFKKNPKPIFQFKNGLKTLTEALIKKSSKNVALNQSIEKIEYKNNTYSIYTSDTIYRTQTIINTLPASITSQIIQFDTAIKASLESLEYASLAVANVFLKSEKKMRDAFGIVIPRHENKMISGIVFNSKVFDKIYNKPFITCIATSIFQPSIGTKKQHELNYFFAKELFELLNIQNPKTMEITFWHNAIPQYNQAFHHFKCELEQFKNRHPNFHFCTNYVQGISVGDCIKNVYELSL